MVYEDADVALQLKGFYDEVASPLLSDIQLTYLDDQAFDVTRSLFPNYFQGSELVVAGRVKPGTTDFKVSLSAVDSKQHIKLENGVPVSHSNENQSASSLDCLGGLEGMPTFVHRLWAYFTIKELLLAKLNESDTAIQKLLTDKATNLSLKYNFVTPVTSLIVVKPDADEAAHIPVTAKPTTFSTATTTAAAVAPSKLSAAGATRKPSSPSNHSPNKFKPNSPLPPDNSLKRKTNPLPTSGSNIRVVPTRKVNTTSSLGHVKIPLASIFGKKPTDSKDAVIPPSSGKISSALPNDIQTAQPHSPEKISTLTPNATLSTNLSMLTFSTSTSATLSSRMDSGIPSEKTSTKHASPVKAALLPVKMTEPSLESEAITTTPPDIQQSKTTTAPHKLPALSTLIPAVAPVVVDGTNSNTDLSIATLVSGTFVPMSGVTAGTGFWEAAGVHGKLYTKLLVMH